MNRKTILQVAILPLFAVLAIGSASPKEGADGKASTTGAPAATIGKAVAVGDAEWTVLDIVNRGSKMKAGDSFEKDAVTAGSFIQVHFKVANTSKKEGVMGDGPKLVDQGSREFGAFENAYAFRPKGASGVLLEKIQPSMSKDYYEIFEVPAGVTTISLKAHDFGYFTSTDKKIDLGSLPAAPVAAAPAATNASGPVAKAGGVAAGTAKAKAAPAKK